MDQFREEAVVKHKKGLENLVYIMSILTMIFLGFFAFLTFQSLPQLFATEGIDAATIIVNVVTLLVSAGGCILIFIYKDRLKVEYDYTFTRDEKAAGGPQMEFAQVFNQKKRKSLGAMNLRNVEACGMVASGSFQRYITMPGIKRTNWFLNRDADLLYFFFQKDGQKRIIIIEPSEEMVTLIKRSLSQGVWQIN